MHSSDGSVSINTAASPMHPISSPLGFTVRETTIPSPLVLVQRDATVQEEPALPASLSTLQALSLALDKLQPLHALRGPSSRCSAML